MRLPSLKTTTVQATDLPTTVVVVDQAAVSRATNLIEMAMRITAVDDNNFERANLVVTELATFARDLEADRKRIKAPFMAITRAIDGAAKDVAAELDDAKRMLANRLALYQRDKARERQRIAEETRRKMIAAQEAARAAAELEATTDADRDARDALLDEAAVIDLPAIPEQIRSAVSIRQVQKVRIVDADKLPRVVNGIEVLEPNLAAIKRLLLANVEVPGAVLVTEEELATRASRVAQ